MAMSTDMGMEGRAIVRLDRSERTNWSSNAGRLRRGTEPRATIRIHAG